MRFRIPDQALAALQAAHPDATPWPACPRYLVYRDGKIIGPLGYQLSTYVQPKWQTPVRYVTVYKDGKPKPTAVRMIVAETYLPRPAGAKRVAYRTDEYTDHVDNLAWVTTTTNKS